MTGVIRLAVVGGGPSCTYALERLAATAGSLPDGTELEIHVFDKGGQFGVGQVHSDGQPVTSFLNRIVGQVAFAADETVEGAGPLLPAEERPTLYEWCRRQFEATGDPAFDLAPEDWPKRYVHGMALRHQFNHYVSLLRARPSVSVLLHWDEVVDLVEQPDGFDVVTAGAAPPLVAQHVLMVTGHSINNPEGLPVRREWARFAETSDAVFVHSAYPLEQSLTPEVATSDRVVGCVGMGLTAIDIVLHLTEGRGGTFEPQPDGSLRYLPSGREPKSIVAFGEAGLFTFARPFNAKERDLAALEHRGVFFTEAAVDRLRESCGTPARIGDLRRLQLDFERHVFPVVVLEMAHLYYTTLLGGGFGAHLAERAEPVYRAFLAGSHAAADGERARAALLAPVEAAIDEAVAFVDAVLAGRASLSDNDAPGWGLEAVRRYLHVVFGPDTAQAAESLLFDRDKLAELVAGAESPHGHEKTLEGNRFSWERSITPIARDQWASPEDYQRAMVEFMVRDHLWAAQDNLQNPSKAAADGVWRDLRPVLGHAVDFGGLDPHSHEVFLNAYMRHHNRLANGAALEVMEKILAVVKAGLVDVSTGPGTRVELEDDAFTAVGPSTGARKRVDVLVDARVHPFAPEADSAPVYPALLRRGLIRKWRNPGSGGPGFEPGGLDLTPRFHPVRADGAADPRLTFLGPPSEGVMFFQLGALRPQQNHHVMQDILCWLEDFWAQVAHEVGRSSQSLAQPRS
ncbi:FAD/NAD(P)-binding protein [Streptomyces sp. NPDC050287]|uniref:FAD/NAD(P)-binding protein n=1 Tax=Streptomyces sp. NPDC050287 TaxID=3365608 RepID=UPI00378BEC39